MKFSAVSILVLATACYVSGQSNVTTPAPPLTTPPTLPPVTTTAPPIPPPTTPPTSPPTTTVPPPTTTTSTSKPITSPPSEAPKTTVPTSKAPDTSAPVTTSSISSTPVVTSAVPGTTSTSDTTVAPVSSTPSVTINSPDETPAPTTSEGSPSKSLTDVPSTNRPTTPQPTSSSKKGSSNSNSENSTTVIVAIVGGVAGVLLLVIAFVLFRRRRAFQNDDDLISPQKGVNRLVTPREQHFPALEAPPRTSPGGPVFSPVKDNFSQPNPYYQPSRVSPPKYPTDGFVSNAQRLSLPPFTGAADLEYDAESICDSSKSSQQNVWVSTMESGRTDSYAKEEASEPRNSLWDDDDSNARDSSSLYDRSDSFISGSNMESFHSDNDSLQFGTPIPASRHNSITL